MGTIRWAPRGERLPAIGPCQTGCWRGAGAAIGFRSGNTGAGAVIGGVSATAVGALSDPCSLNLGNRWWRDHDGGDEYYRRCGR